MCARNGGLVPKSNDLRTAYTVIFLHGLTNFGFGLVYPFTAIYLAGRPGVGTAGAALYFAAAGATNVVVAIVLTARRTRMSHYALASVGAACCVAGSLTMSQAAVLPVVLLAAACNGAGQGCFMAAVVPLINSKVPAERRRPVFAHRYQVLNLTLALGALLAGVVANALGRSVLPWLYVAQAAGILPLGALLVRGALAGDGRDPDPDRAPAPTGDALPVRGLLGRVGPAALFQLGAFAFAFSQLEATMPLVADQIMHLRLIAVSVMVALNVAVILAAQGLVTRLLSRHAETAGLRVAVSCWAAGFAVAAVASWGPTPVRVGGLVGYVVLFSIGECAYSCSFHPWLIAAVPEPELVRANALVNSTMGVGLFAGPSLGSALVRVGDAGLVWGVLAVCSATVLLTVRRGTADLPVERVG